MVSAKSRRSADVPADVKKLQERFVRWRENKEAAAEPIPARLWEAAVELCRSHGVSRVSGWLRLHYPALKKRLGKRSCPSSVRLRPRFVEWRLPAGGLPGSSAAEYVVEVPNSGDAAQRIHVRGASVAEVVALSRALRAAGSAG
jgi:hypothetical protein